jgi:putative spermidine/putrescine transport system substrate-binding protein
MRVSFITRIACAALGFLSVIALSQSALATGELRLAFWEGYGDDDWVAEFESKFDCKANVIYNTDLGDLWTKIKATEGKDYDIFALDTGGSLKYWQHGLTRAWDLSKIPNTSNQLAAMQDLTRVPNAIHDGEPFGIPMAWGSMGIIYDVDQVVPAPTSWDALWDPKYKGKILVSDFDSDMITMAAQSLGIKDPFHLTDPQLAQVREKLATLLSHSKAIYKSAEESLRMWEEGDIVMMFANLGELQEINFNEAGHNIRYVFPEENDTFAWLDVFSLTVGVEPGSDRYECAHHWVNFFLEKRISEQMTERYGYGSTVSAAASYRPTDRVIWKTDVESDQGRTDMWNELKASAGE